MAEQQKQSQKVNPQHAVSSRRNFIKGVAVSSALITTITSKPVWASQCSISGNLSGNASHHDENEVCYPRAYSHGAWLYGSAQQLWLHLPVSKDSLLSGIFAGSTSLGNKTLGDFPDATIRDALQKNLPVSNGHGAWLMQLTTAYLNSLAYTIAMTECAANPACSILDDISLDGFYWPYTTIDVQNWAASGKDGIHYDQYGNTTDLENLFEVAFG